jgi:hypothetical protein
MVDRGDGGRGQVEHESVECQVVEEPPGVGELLVRVCATRAVALEVTHPKRVGGRLLERGNVYELVR